VPQQPLALLQKGHKKTTYHLNGGLTSAKMIKKKIAH
jgi:flagellar biosynthesis/type III secretory pathway chaperone